MSFSDFGDIYYATNCYDGPSDDNTQYQRVLFYPTGILRQRWQSGANENSQKKSWDHSELAQCKIFVRNVRQAEGEIEGHEGYDWAHADQEHEF